MASSPQHVIAAAADAAGGGASAGQMSVSTGAVIAVCTSIATFALQFIIRTLALGRWQGQIEARVAAGELRAAERHVEAEARAAGLMTRLDQVKDEVLEAVASVEHRQQKALEHLEARYVRQRDELLGEIRLLRERGGSVRRGGEG